MENNRYKVLIVDDNEKNIQVLANLLSANNYDVEYALNGLDAIELVDSEDVDIILLDIMMPGMDGFEVCRKIKKKPKTNGIPIIFLTAKTDVDSIERAFKNGGADYLSKPFNSNELLARVKTHIELKTSKDKLKQTNKWLEEKVLERTAELFDANKKLLELDNAKTQFLDIISHEIRTPLNGIIGGLSLLKDSGLNEEASSLIELLDISATRLEHFSDNALDISLFNMNGKKVLRPEKINIDDFILKIITTLELPIINKDITISKAFNTKISTVNIDSKYFNKCLHNIIDNAIKFSPDKGSILITTSSSDKYLNINIKDEGIGFNKEFSIVDIGAFNNKNHIDENPGLGLYLSNQIVKAHGGRIENGNNIDRGAYVKVILPVN